MPSALRDFSNSVSGRIAAFALSAAAVTVPAAANAQSLPFEGGKCYDQGTVLAALKADGQLEIASGRRLLDNGPYNIITMNTKGYMYNFEQKRSGENTPKLCLAFKARDGIVDDSSTRPSWTKIIGVNGNINPDEFYKKGGRIWAGAHGFSVSPTGQEIPGQLVAVTASKLDARNIGETGVLWNVSNKGIPSTLKDIRDIKINTQNIAFLMANGRAPVAEASHRR